MMERVFLIHYGEVGLKGKNRSYFEKKLVQNIKRSLKGLGCLDVYRIYGRILVTFQADSDITAIREKLSKIMGVAHFALACATEQNIEAIQTAALNWIRDRAFETLKVETKRANKSFPMTSPEISAVVGGYLLEHTGASAKMRNPDLLCHIEIVEKAAYIRAEKIQGIGGLPVGVSGKVLVMLSGGIDSPVAAWRMMRRGAKVIHIHFYSYPYTDKASLEKVKALAQLLAIWNYHTLVYLVPFADIQREIVTKTPAPFRVILYRRFMARIAQQIAKVVKADALVTGESLGQVASQTLGNLRSIDDAVEIPILRPLIGDDKEEIIRQAQQIKTFEISTLPHDDCCSLFVPDHPATNASIDSVRAAEMNLETDALIEKAVKNIEKLTICD